MSDHHTRNVLSIFLGSPGDVTPERQIAREVVEELNRTFNRTLGWHIELLGWEDTLPGAGRPQARINADVDACDLFIGVLWGRWGTPTGEFDSGFQEEFERARARYQDTGKPERWLFFKQIESDRLRDPGPQLQRVLTFRAEQIALREVLFKDFTDPEEWRNLLRETLSRYLLDLALPRLQGASVPSSGAAGSTTVAPTSPTTSSSPESTSEASASNTQLVDSMRNAADVISGHDFSSASGHLLPIDQFEVARLYLFAATLMNGRYTKDLLGVHQVNFLYLYKERFELTDPERSLLLRTLIGDRNEIVPGCYWFRDLPPDDVIFFLSLAAAGDSNSSVQIEAIEILINLGVSPSIAFHPSIGSLIPVLTNEDFSLRTAGFNYLSSAGTADDLALIETFLIDKSNSTFHNEALFAKLAIISKISPEEAFVGLLANPQLKVQDLLERLNSRANEISTPTLLSGIRNANNAVREFIVIELMRREALSTELAISMLDDSSEAVKELCYLQLIEQGTEIEIEKMYGNLKSQISVRRQLAPVTSVNSKENPNAVIMKLLGKLSLEVLKEQVEFYRTSGAMAYKALGLYHFPMIADDIRSDLGNNFVRLKQISLERLKTSYGSNAESLMEMLNKSETLLRGEFTVAALTAIGTNGEGQDVEIGRQYLTDTDLDVLYEAVQIVERLGDSTDADALINIARNNSHNHIGSLAAYAALKLSPGIDGAVPALLETEMASLVKITVRALLDEDKVRTVELLKPFLYSKNDDVRLKVLAYFTKRCSKEELEALLAEYPKPSNTRFYYYNVVCHLDRVLYAPQPLKNLCRYGIESELDE